MAQPVMLKGVDVRFGSKADMTPVSAMSAVSPKADIRR